MRDDANLTSAPPSKIELLKRASDHLRGTIAPALGEEVAHFDDDDAQLLKFHGIYQQDDRDLRLENRKKGLDKAWSMMIRLNIPGGRLTPAQYLDLDRLADSHANGSLRITTRQSIQYHGVVKGELKGLIRGVSDSLLTTLAACGDVQRNVMAIPAPIDDAPHAEIRRLAGQITERLMPRSGAYFDIWVDGEKAHSSDDEQVGEEPFYGDRYLPRKFKTGIALDDDNSVDLFAYDCGLIGLTEGGRIVGYNLTAGGGFGMTHRKPDTIARLASIIGFVPPDHAVDAVGAVAQVFRDHGNRSDRRHARLKYLLEDWGVDRFRREIQAIIDWKLLPPRPLPELRQLDYLGRHDQGGGRWFYGVFVQNGRVVDRDGVLMRSAFRAIARELGPSIHLTPMQSIIFGGLSDEGVARLESILDEHGVARESGISNARRFSMACPALPTCGVALAESERLAPFVFDAIASEIERLGLADLELNIRMTGCPNGCARPYNADIGLVGRKPGVYHLYVGGGLSGTRLADLYAGDVPVEELVPALRPLLERFASEREPGEGLSEFYQRLVGREAPRLLLHGAESPTQEFVQLQVRP